MKSKVLILTFLLITVVTYSKTPKNVAVGNAGSLISLFSSEELNITDSLVVSGNINAQDFKFMRDNLTVLSFLDMSNANIQQYSGVSGTANNTNTTYPINTVPNFAFYTGAWSGKNTLKTVILPKNTTSIGEYAFRYCQGLVSISIPDEVASIGKEAFLNCSKLKSVTLPKSLIKLGKYLKNDVCSNCEGIFVGCTSLETIVFQNNIEYIGNSTFNGCSSLASISLPETIKYIGTAAFGNCSKLATINLPNGLLDIEYGAFSGCSSLNNVELPTSLRYMGREAFSGCINLSTPINFSGDTILDNSFSSCLKLEEIRIKSTTKVIGYGILSECLNLKVVDAPAKLINQVLTPGYSFSQYSNRFSNKLQLVKINSDTLKQMGVDFLKNSYRTIKSIDLSESVNAELPAELLSNFYSLENLSLPKSIVIIPYRGVSDCVSLKEILIPASTTDIEMRAFENCRSLKTINFGENSQLKTIGNWSFYACHALENINIPTGVTTIGDGAFWSCDYLKNVNLPSSILSIGDNSFEACKSISKIKVNAIIPPALNDNTFNLVDKNIPVIVPEGSLIAYKTTPIWKDFKNLSSSDINSIDNANQLQYAIFTKGQNILINNAMNCKITVLDVSGRIVSTIQKATEFEKICIINPGIYFVKVDRQTTKIIIE